MSEEESTIYGPLSYTKEWKHPEEDMKENEDYDAALTRMEKEVGSKKISDNGDKTYHAEVTILSSRKDEDGQM
jgi:hypothetical protein